MGNGSSATAANGNTATGSRGKANSITSTTGNVPSSVARGAAKITGNVNATTSTLVHSLASALPFINTSPQKQPVSLSSHNAPYVSFSNAQQQQNIYLQNFAFVIDNENIDDGNGSTAGGNDTSLDQNKLIKPIVLGNGAFGSIIVIKKKDSGNKLYALKTISKSKVIKLDRVNNVLNELHILTAMKHHSFIVNLWYAFQDEQNLYEVLDAMFGGNLAQLLAQAAETSDTSRISPFDRTKRVGYFPEHQARFYIAEIVLAIQFLHENRVIHRDLNLQNILIDADGHIRVTNFNVSLKFPPNDPRLDEPHQDGWGTRGYRAPEIYLREGRGFLFACDWWSAGAILYQMLVGWVPYKISQDEEPVEMLKKVYANDFDITVLPSPHSISLCERLLKFLPSERIGCEDGPNSEVEIMTHEFFLAHEVDWDKLERRVIKAPWIPTPPPDKDFFVAGPTAEFPTPPKAGSKLAKKNANPTDDDNILLDEEAQSLFQNWAYNAEFRVEISKKPKFSLLQLVTSQSPAELRSFVIGATEETLSGLCTEIKAFREQSMEENMKLISAEIRNDELHQKNLELKLENSKYKTLLGISTEEESKPVLKEKSATSPVTIVEKPVTDNNADTNKPQQQEAQPISNIPAVPVIPTDIPSSTHFFRRASSSAHYHETNSNPFSNPFNNPFGAEGGATDAPSWESTSANAANKANDDDNFISAYENAALQGKDDIIRKEQEARLEELKRKQEEDAITKLAYEKKMELEVSEQRKKIESLTKELEQYEKKVVEYQISAREKENSAVLIKDTLERSLKEKDTKIEEYIVAIASKQFEINEKEKKIQDLTDQLTRAKEAAFATAAIGVTAVAASKMDQPTVPLSEYDSLKTQHQTELSKLSNQIKERERELSQQQALVNERQITISSLTNVEEELTKQINTKETLITEQVALLAIKQREVDEKDTQIKHLQQEIVTIKLSSNSAAESESALSETAKEKDMMITQLQEQLSTVSVAVKEKQDALQSIQSQLIAEQENKRLEGEQIKAAYEQRLTLSRNEIQTLVMKLEETMVEKQTMIAEQKRTIEENAIIISQKEAKIAELENRINMLSSSSDSNVQALQKSITDATAEAEKSKNENVEISKSLQRLDEEKKKEIAELMAKVEALSKTVKERESKIIDLENSLEMMQLESSSAAETSTKAIESEKKLQDLIQAKETLEKENKLKDVKMEEQMQLLTKQKKDIDSFNQQIKEKERKIAELDRAMSLMADDAGAGASSAKTEGGSDEVVLELTEKVADLEAQLAEKDNQLEEQDQGFEKAIKERETILNQREKVITRLQGDVEKLQDTIGELEDQIKELEKEATAATTPSGAAAASASISRKVTSDEEKVKIQQENEILVQKEIERIRKEDEARLQQEKKSLEQEKQQLATEKDKIAQENEKNRLELEKMLADKDQLFGTSAKRSVANSGSAVGSTRGAGASTNQSESGAGDDDDDGEDQDDQETESVSQSANKSTSGMTDTTATGKKKKKGILSKLFSRSKKSKENPQ